MERHPALKDFNFDCVFDCPRCDGKGFIRAFSHINSGRCFLCGGGKTIGRKTRYMKKGLVCRVSKGMRNQYVDHLYEESIQVYREEMAISFDCGRTFPWEVRITDKNRELMREIWLWCKTNGAEMQLDERDIPPRVWE